MARILTPAFTIVILAVLLQPALAVPLQHSGERADTTSRATQEPHPNTVPYRSDRSFGQHLLALPSYLLHWTTRPIGYGVKLAERKLPQLLQGERGSVGIYPLFELGGETGSAFGFLLFHNQFLKWNHKARLEVLFGSEDFNDVDFEYEIPGFISRSGKLELDATYANDPIKSLFGGNRSDREDERFYATEELGGTLEYRQPLGRSFRFSLTGGLQRMRVTRSEHKSNPDTTVIFPAALTGTTTLGSIGGSLAFNGTQGRQRVIRGSRFNLQLDWFRSLNNNQNNYLKYDAQWHQFIPLFFLPETRRLAFKSRIIKVETLNDGEIPFFDYPSLGDARDLRGFSSDRFQDDGSLLFTLEYRYPFWDFADAVLFVDEGQVFSRLSDIAIDDFHTGYGFGFHFLSAKGFAFRTEFAFSRETSRFILSINPNF